MRSSVTMSLCRYVTFTPTSAKYSLRFSAIRLVSVVTRTRSFRSARRRHSSSRSSIWPFTGRTSTIGSSKPVGRMICSITSPSVFCQFDTARASPKHRSSARRRASNSSKVQRPVVLRRRQTKTVFDQRSLSRLVALVHRSELRHRLVRFVDHHHRVLRQIIEQRRRRLARRSCRSDVANNSRCRGKIPSP